MALPDNLHLTLDEMVALRQRGNSYSSIARAAGCSLDTAHYHISKATGGIETMVRNWTVDAEARLAELVAADPPMQWRQIGDLMDRSESAVQRHAAKLGLVKQGARQPKADPDAVVLAVTADEGALMAGLRFTDARTCDGRPMTARERAAASQQPAYVRSASSADLAAV